MKRALLAAIVCALLLVIAVAFAVLELSGWRNINL